ncbi:MAG: rod-binding protein [Bacillota bacterium]
MKIGDQGLGLMHKEQLNRKQNRSKDFATELKAAAKQSKQSSDRQQQLRKATEKFSSIFVHKMLKEMRQSIPESEMLDGGMKEDIFKDMLDRKYATKMIESKQLKLADQLYNQLSKQL